MASRESQLSNILNCIANKSPVLSDLKGGGWILRFFYVYHLRQGCLSQRKIMGKVSHVMMCEFLWSLAPVLSWFLPIGQWWEEPWASGTLAPAVSCEQYL